MTHYVPSAEDVARYRRLMLKFPELGEECPTCQLGITASDDTKQCWACQGTGIIAPPPETWCGLLVRVAQKHVALDEFPDGTWGVVIGNGRDDIGPHPESALLAALEQAAAEKEAWDD
jgi:hypothetical protein